MASSRLHMFPQFSRWFVAVANSSRNILPKTLPCPLDGGHIMPLQRQQISSPDELVDDVPTKAAIRKLNQLAHDTPGNMTGDDNKQELRLAFFMRPKEPTSDERVDHECYASDEGEEYSCFKQSSNVSIARHVGVCLLLTVSSNTGENHEGQRDITMRHRTIAACVR